MDDIPISLEELWINLQISNIKTIKLRGATVLDHSLKFGDNNQLIWNNFLTKHHDGYDPHRYCTYRLYTFEIDTVEQFRPLKLKGFDPFDWYYFTIVKSPANYNYEKWVLQFMYKSTSLLYKEFTDIKDLSGDKLLNW